MTAEHVSLEFKSSTIAPIAADNVEDDEDGCVELIGVCVCVCVCADVCAGVGVGVAILCDSDGRKNETERRSLFWDDCIGVVFSADLGVSFIPVPTAALALIFSTHSSSGTDVT